MGIKNWDSFYLSVSALLLSSTVVDLHRGLFGLERTPFQNQHQRKVGMISYKVGMTLCNKSKKNHSILSSGSASDHILLSGVRAWLSQGRI